MSLIKVEDIAFVRFGAPNLAVMRDFLIDFGLHEANSSGRPEALYMRGSGPAPFVHVTELGEPGFRGLGLRARSVEDLETVAEAEGLEVEPIQAPGGGKMVRLTDPEGFVVDLIADQEQMEVHPVSQRTPWNIWESKPRTNLPKRLVSLPAEVTRLGHAVFIVNDLQRSWDWWQHRFGLIVSDEVQAPDGTPVAMFIRCDRGSEAADHHSLNFASIPGKSAVFHHAAFEVADLDDLMTGHEYLKAKGHSHVWGVGRHILGSQVFDYWCDPFGNKMEHWTDGDMFAADSPPTITDLPTMLGTQWGPPAPPTFV